MAYIITPAARDPRVRAPRVWLKISGMMLPCISASVLRKSERHADTFEAELSVNETAAVGFGYAEWADYQPVDVEIVASLDGSTPVSLITGQIDEPDIHWGECTVSMKGRDKSAPLTEKRRSQQFKNQKSSDIVSTIASDHGLGSTVTNTQGFAGKLYDTDFVHLILNHASDHDVLSRLADREGFRWYVEGKSLAFEPRGTDADVYKVQWVPPDGQSRPGFANCLDLRTHRNMPAARPHSVTVKSWNHKEAKKHEGNAKSEGVGDTAEIEHHHNGRDKSGVDGISKSRLKAAIRHDCNVVVKAPADLSVTPRMKMQLGGTGTIFDQLYDIDTVTFDLGWEPGATMTVAGKIAKSGRSGTDNSGSTKNTPAAPGSTTTTPLPPERPAGIGTNSNATPLTTPAGSSGIGSA